MKVDHSALMVIFGSEPKTSPQNADQHSLVEVFGSRSKITHDTKMPIFKMGSKKESFLVVPIYFFFSRFFLFKKKLHKSERLFLRGFDPGPG